MNPREMKPKWESGFDKYRGDGRDQHHRDPGIAESAMELGVVLAAQARPKGKRPEKGGGKRGCQVDDELRGETGKRLHGANVPRPG